MSHNRIRSAIAGVVAAAIAAALALVAAGGDGGADTHGGDGHPRPAHLIDWEARTARLPDARWSVDFCDGDAPVLCLTDAEGDWGDVELGSWPAGELDVLEEAFARGATNAEALSVFAADFLRTFEEDREEGCGPGYRFVADATAPVTVAGRPGLRYGFRGVVDGTTIEHVVGHAVIIDDTLHLLSAAGLADDGCLGREGEFPISDFDDSTVALLDRIAAASRLPSNREQDR